MSLKTILNRAGDAITATRASRLAIAGERSSRLYVDNLKKQLEDVEGEMEDLLDISARVDLNAGSSKLSGKDMEFLVTSYHKKSEERYLLQQKLKVAEGIYKELTKE